VKDSVGFVNNFQTIIGDKEACRILFLCCSGLKRLLCRFVSYGCSRKSEIVEGGVISGRLSKHFGYFDKKVKTFSFE